MTVSEYFRLVLTDYMTHSRSLLPEASLPEKILEIASGEIDPAHVIQALTRTAIVGGIYSPNLRFHDVEIPAQAAGQLYLVAASRLRNIAHGRASTELKESVFADAFTLFCLAYTAPDAAAFDLVIAEMRSRSVFLPQLAVQHII